MGAALAADGGAGLRLVAMAPAREDAASAAFRAAGATGSDALPACERVATGLLLCVVSGDGGVVSEGALAKQGASLADVLAEARVRVPAAWAKSPPTAQSVEGMKGSWLLRAAGDGFDAAGLLVPELLKVPGATETAVVAVPVDGTVMWWTPGDADFDKVLAVGVRRMAEASEAPVSSRIYRWSAEDERWTVWGEVRGSVALPPAAPTGAPPR